MAVSILEMTASGLLMACSTSLVLLSTKPCDSRHRQAGILGSHGLFGNKICRSGIMMQRLYCGLFPRSDSIAAGKSLCYIFFAIGKSYETRNSSRIQSCDNNLRVWTSGRDTLDGRQYSRRNLLQLPPFLYWQTKIAGLSGSGRQVQEKVRPEEASGGLRGKLLD